MKKRSYYKNGVYIDVTTGREYIPKNRCEICRATYLLDVHHYLSQQRCMNDLKTKVVYPKTWTREFIDKNQKLFTVCRACHTDIENLSDEKFYNKYGIERSNFIYRG